VKLTNNGGFNIGGINATGQVPVMPNNFALIDSSTPKDAYTHKPFTSTGKDWQLVFSDEFEVEGRSFYPGDDPYWEAVDLHYWQVRIAAASLAARAQLTRGRRRTTWNITPPRHSRPRTARSRSRSPPSRSTG
jgi:beta-glucanase (GH16 family)